ncbi:hypothetical protein [Pseudomonas sp. 3-2]|uniref:hypothetical protein n=1 Tax=Pseudomonas sp. 3-2 TaxID=2867408 RepID=UPI001C88B43D|nr:hypothetical protein [Pseudomonas sp. 3-2]QZD72872.1 hypothetical protein K3819_08380 [Pseudomonas sp. 3-2]
MTTDNDSQPVPEELAAVPAVQNWKLKAFGQQELSITEYPLYTDAHITGNIQKKDWPYDFLNTIPHVNEPGMVRHSITLRIEEYFCSTVPDFSKTSNLLFHGGLIQDEIAALASLCLGARIKAGGMSRIFGSSASDPLGRPTEWDYRLPPSLTVDKSRLILPEVTGTHSLDELIRFELLPTLNSQRSIALVRAARFYQDALWIAESEPSLAWLLLVSSLETAANEWRAENGTASQRLTESKPELVARLMEYNDDNLVQFVAEQIEHTLGATKKFIDFTLNFLPSPPPLRPDLCDQFSWKRKPMKNMLGTVYQYRSYALHGGIPFPPPMCDPTRKFDESLGYSEVGTTALAVSSYGGVWTAGDLPINLHAFHYIVRGALLGWWESMGAK